MSTHFNCEYRTHPYHFNALSIVFLTAGQEDLVHFLAANDVRVVASLPCYSEKNVNMQRGKGVFGRSISGLQTLNAAGYGKENSKLVLDLVYNPLKGVLPPGNIHNR